MMFFLLPVVFSLEQNRRAEQVLPGSSVGRREVAQTMYHCIPMYVNVNDKGEKN
jgi:hypothetical protein